MILLDRHGNPISVVIPSMIGMLHDVDVSTILPSDGNTLVWVDADKKWEPGTISGGAPATYTYTKTGPIAIVSTGTKRIYNDTGATLTITAIRATLDIAPLTTSVIVDVNMNGTTLYTTQSNRPVLGTTINTDLAPLPDITAWTAGSYLTVDVDQGDSGLAEDLCVQITAT